MSAIYLTDDPAAQRLEEGFENSVLGETDCRGDCGQVSHDLYVTLEDGENPKEIAGEVDGVEFKHTVDTSAGTMAKFDYVVETDGV